MIVCRRRLNFEIEKCFHAHTRVQSHVCMLSSHRFKFDSECIWICSCLFCFRVHFVRCDCCASEWNPIEIYWATRKMFSPRKMCALLMKLYQPPPYWICSSAEKLLPSLSMAAWITALNSSSASIVTKMFAAILRSESGSVGVSMGVSETHLMPLLIRPHSSFYVMRR